MRCDQLADIGRRHLGDRYTFAVRALPDLETEAGAHAFAESLSGRIVILLKGTGAILGEAGMEMLRGRTRGLAIDYVDARARDCFSPHADLHIAASRKGEAILNRVLVRRDAGDGRAGVAHLTHHYDPRLVGRQMVDPGDLRAAYLGHPRNVYLPDVIAAHVTRIDPGGEGGIEAGFDRLCGFNLHYAIRPPDHAQTLARDLAKPFTKGFTAAAFGANVMVTCDTDDAEFYLGRDYPFLVADHQPATIAEAFARAQGLYATADWHEARDRMRHLRNLSAPAQVARELDVILSRLMVRDAVDLPKPKGAAPVSRPPV
ncbi:hypothetical protein [Roseovarius sp. MBR-154]